MFSIPKTGPLLKVERYKVNGRVMAVFAQSVAESETYCAALPDCEFTGNQNRKFTSMPIVCMGCLSQISTVYIPSMIAAMNELSKSSL